MVPTERCRARDRLGNQPRRSEGAADADFRDPVRGAQNALALHENIAPLGW